MRYIFLCGVLSLLLTGCEFYSSHPKTAEVWPTYSSLPAKPKLDIPSTVVPNKNPELDSMIRNVYNLTAYADSLKIIIDTHNAAAKSHNAKVEQELKLNPNR